MRRLFELRTYTGLIYLLLAFPTGLIYFLFYVVGGSLGLGLVVILVGIPILFSLVTGTCVLAEFERGLARGLLGAEIGPPRDLHHPPQTWRDRLFDMNWVREAIFLFLKFPLGLMTFVFTVTLTALSFSLIVAPLIPGSAIGIMGWTFNSIFERLIVLALGLILLPFVLTVMQWMQNAWIMWTEAVLGHPDEIPPEKRKRSAQDALFYGSDEDPLHIAKAKNDDLPQSAMRNRFLDQNKP